MRPGAAHILACPHCQVWLRCQAIELDRRAGVTVWSDLRVEHAFWQSPARMARCGSCGKPFCRDSAEHVGVLPSSLDVLEQHPNWRPWRWAMRDNRQRLAQFEAAPLAESLSEASIERALASAAPQDEIDLRIQLWRHHNDRRRRGDGLAFGMVEGSWRDNLNRLLALLHPEDELHNLLAAEIHRQSGNFHRAMGCLSGVRQGYGREKAALMGWIVEGRSELMVFY